MDKWRGRVALVTGASAGIGASLAQNLALKGMKVVACARRLEKLEEMADEVNKGNHGGKIFPYKCDMSDFENIADMFKWIEGQAELGQVDVCICNAGLAINKTLSELTPDEMKQMMHVNVISASYCTQLSVLMMMKKGIDDGHIIFIGSSTAHKVGVPPNMAFYSASKHAMKSLLEGWRNELRSKGKNGIRIGAVSPGFVKTEAIMAANNGNQALSDMIYAATPHLLADDVSDAVMGLLTAKPYVQIHDVLLRHVDEK